MEVNIKKIALTGGPGGGKSTACDIVAKSAGERVVVLPEAATMLYNGGFPKVNLPAAKIAVQKAIYHVQHNLEDLQSFLFPNRVLVCDRGSIDGAVYWPAGPKDFFHHMNTTLEKELSRYDAVVFFETAAAGNRPINGGNPLRAETLQEAIELDEKLRALWQKHPKFFLIPNEPSFLHKLNLGVDLILQMVHGKLHGKLPQPSEPRTDHQSRYSGQD